jgi:hypothetical protein
MPAQFVPDRTTDLADIAPTPPSDGQVLVWDATTGRYEPRAGATGDLHYVHVQSTPAASATIVHNLGKYPAVVVVDSAETVLVGDVTYLDLNRVFVDLGVPFPWTAYLN